MSVTQEKILLRKTFLQFRRSLSPQEKGDLDALITSRVLQSSTYLSAETVLCYVSVPIEVDTHSILSDAIRRGKRTAVPRCRENGRMDFHVITSMHDLEPGMRGIPEPAATCTLYVPQPNDLCIVPCIAADTRGYRLGYGGGYYDRYLAAHPMQTIGLCYYACMTDTLPTDSFDIPLQMVISDKEVSINGRMDARK